jgi:hypothetical protein
MHVEEELAAWVSSEYGEGQNERSKEKVKALEGLK